METEMTFHEMNQGPRKGRRAIGAGVVVILAVSTYVVAMTAWHGAPVAAAPASAATPAAYSGGAETAYFPSLYQNQAREPADAVATF
jgi:hypothetical protein